MTSSTLKTCQWFDQELEFEMESMSGIESENIESNNSASKAEDQRESEYFTVSLLSIKVWQVSGDSLKGL